MVVAEALLDHLVHLANPDLPVHQALQVSYRLGRGPNPAGLVPNRVRVEQKGFLVPWHAAPMPRDSVPM